MEILGQQRQGLEEAICAAEAELQVASDIPYCMLTLVRQLVPLHLASTLHEAMLSDAAD